MNNSLVKFTFLLSALVLSLTIQAMTLQAHEKDPAIFVKNITNSMIEKLNVSKSEIRENPSIILDIVDRQIMPHISKTTISRKVMGKTWKKATDQQKDKFVEEFTLYLKRFYSKAFLSFDNQTIEFDPNIKLKGKKLAIVSTKVLRSGQKPVEIQYRLYLKKDGWKVVDIVIEGISLVISNQRQYAGLIAREGLDAVTAKLAYNNQQEFK